MNQTGEAPLVSIVTPSFNQGRFLEFTIQSVLNQDYPRIEYIIIDGGSTDGSVDIIRKYEGRLAYWVSEKDAGQSDAINKGWRRASGDIIAYLNSDDTYEPGAVRAAAEFLTNHPDVAMAYGDCNQIDENGEKVGILTAPLFDLQQLLLGNFIMQQSVFIRRSALGKVGWLDTRLDYSMDYDLWVRLALHFRVAPAPQIRANFRGHSASKSFAQPQRFLDDHLLIIEKAFDDPALPPGCSHLREMAVSRAYLMTILLSYAVGQGQAGRQLWSDLLSHEPHFLEGPDYVLELIANTMIHNVATPWLTKQSTDSGAWLGRMLSDVPGSPTQLNRLKRKILARVQVVSAFDAYRRGEWGEIRACFWRAFRSDPSCLKNRGFRSIFLESIVGTHVMRAWRQTRGEHLAHSAI